MIDEDGKGISMVDLAPENKYKTNVGNNIHDRVHRGLQFQIPDVRPLYVKAKLSPSMLHVLLSNKEHSLMDEDLLEVWYRIDEGSITKINHISK